MKTFKIVLLLVTVSLIIVSCTTKTKKENTALKAEIAKLKNENSKLKNEEFTMSSEIGEYRLMLEDIDENIAALDSKNHIVKEILTTDKNDEDVEDDILLHISHMHSLLENSSHKVLFMEKNVKQLRKVDNADYEEIHRLEMEVHNMARTIVARDNEIGALHEMVIAEGIGISALLDAYNEQTLYTDVLKEIINTAFFVAGTKKELRDMGIVDMKGGFVGIGRVKALNENASLEFMIPIDIDKTDDIELDGKKAELITPHPDDSYSIVYNDNEAVTNVNIEDKLHFWQETNYLVIELKK
jgi:hypothetical protein